MQAHLIGRWLTTDGCAALSISIFGRKIFLAALFVSLLPPDGLCEWPNYRTAFKLKKEEKWEGKRKTEREKEWERQRKRKGGEERDRTSEKRRMRKKEKGRRGGDRKNDRKATQESGQRVSVTLRDCEFLARSNGEVLHLIMTSHNRDNASLCGRCFPRNCERGKQSFPECAWVCVGGGVYRSPSLLFTLSIFVRLSWDYENFTRAKIDRVLPARDERQHLAICASHKAVGLFDSI